MIVSLYKVGRNLNRAVRTCYSFGIRQLELIDCQGEVEGGLYSAKEQVALSRMDMPSDFRRTVLLETDGDVPLVELDWSRVDRLMVGGESISLPKVKCLARVRIATPNPLCLTTEAALSIALASRNGSPVSLPRNWRHVGHGLYAAGLLRASDVAWFAGRVKSVVDLTQRPRPTIARACERHGIDYHKLPTGYDETPDVVSVLQLPRPLVVHCFHGRDRTGRFIDQWMLHHAD